MLKLFATFFLISATHAVFDSAAQKAIVNAHNALRSKIAKGTYQQKLGRLGPAANMRKISWDKSIAAKAQAYADSQPMGHSATKYGENIYWKYDMRKLSTASLGKLGAKACEVWENEFKKTGIKSIKQGSSVGAQTGHATQMAWADTNKIGCGVASWRGQQYMVTAVICQYSTAGNVSNTDMFKAGNAGSQCPSGTNVEASSGLCV